MADMHGRRILLVEDEYWLAVDLQQQAEDYGAEVIGPVPSVAEALELVASEKIDAAIVDINLGGEMAFAVADALREANVPFIFLTGYDRGALPERFAAIKHCNKPIDPRQVFDALLGQ